MHAAEMLALDPADFEVAFRDVPLHEVAALNAAERGEWYRKVQLATAYIDKSVASIRRGQQGLEQLDRAARLRADIEDDETPPDAVTLRAGANGYDHPDLMERTPRRNLIDWSDLATKEPPPFDWLLDHWLSWHPTLLAGRGGIGKSLLAQQLATALAIGRPLFGTSCAPVKILYWACEDDHDEIWRRQDRICKSLGIGFEMLGRLSIDARCGLENAIFATEYGRPAWTPLYKELQDEVNDTHAQVLILDNISQTFGGNENDRHHVTKFLNGIIGLKQDAPFCPIILGHLSKSPTSEYSGSTAWENAVRMRWYLAEKLPGEAGVDQTEPGAEASDTRFLCKRKTNYSTNDYVQFRFENGVLKVQGEDPSTGGMMDGLRAMRARTLTLAAVQRLAAMGIYCQGDPGRNYLPAKIVEMKLGEGYSKAELRAAMNALIVDGQLVKTEVGKNSNRTPKYGLKLA